MVLQPTIRISPIVVASILLISFAALGRVCADDLAVVEQRLLADAADGTLDEFSLLEASLIASGVKDERAIERYSSEFAHRIGRLSASGDHRSSGITEPERAYQLLHDEFLIGSYHSTCTEIDRAFDAGDYNCVTATVLYQCICKWHGLSPVAVAT